MDNNFKTVNTIINNRKQEAGNYTFEYDELQVSTIKDTSNNYYMRVLHKSCSAENNGRPVTCIRDDCYPIDKNTNVTVDNWKKIRFNCIDKEITLESRSYSGV